MFRYRSTIRRVEVIAIRDACVATDLNCIDLANLVVSINAAFQSADCYYIDGSNHYGQPLDMRGELSQLHKEWTVDWDRVNDSSFTVTLRASNANIPHQ